MIMKMYHTKEQVSTFGILIVKDKVEKAQQAKLKCVNEEKVTVTGCSPGLQGVLAAKSR